MAPMIAAGTGAAGIGTPAARWAMLCVWAAGVAQSAMLGRPEQVSTIVLLALAAVFEVVATVIVTERSSKVLTRRAAVSVAALAIVSAVMMLTAVDDTASWEVDYASYLGALLIARGSVRTGIVVGAVTLACVPVFGAIQGDVLESLLSLGLPLVALCIGGLWRVGLGFVVRRERAHRSAEARATFAIDAAHAAADGYRRQLQRIRCDVTPLLERIASGIALTDSELVDLQVAEGAIRDRLRSPRMNDDVLASALAAARRRGVVVSLLWSEGPGESPGAALVSALAELVDEAEEGSVVIRAADPRCEVTVVRTGAAGTSRVVLGADGRVRAVL